MRVFVLITLAAAGGAWAAPDPTPELLALGQRIFEDPRFSSPRGDMQTSCASCHMERDVQGDRAFTEMLSRSWHPFRNEDPGRETLRNAPTLFDVGLMPRIHHDGEFGSLEEQTRETYLGRNMGWLPQERDEALAHLQAVLQADSGYRKEFQTALHLDSDAAPPEILLDAMAQAVAAFMRALESPRNTPYDAFMEANRLDPGPRPGESAEQYGNRLLWEIVERIAAGTLVQPEDFPDPPLQGYKVFLRTSGVNQAGNCVSCHVPPAFTDFQFHNTGVAQDEYDRIHGEGAFLTLKIPEEAANRPLARLMARPSAQSPETADLGFWNFAAAQAGDKPLDAESFNAALGAFKTPTLRHLASTGPYMHNGEYPTLEAVLLQKARAGQETREGRIRNPHPAIAAIRFSEDDLKALFAFLNTLNERNARIARPTAITAGDNLAAPRSQLYRGY